MAATRGYPLGSGDAAGGSDANATVRNRAKGWPMDVGPAGVRPGASAGGLAPGSTPIGGNPATVRQPEASALDYQVWAATPSQHHVVHQGRVVGYATRYTDPGHGALWSATIADDVHALNPDRAKTRPGFVHSSDAAAHVMDAHRDVAQIENVGNWRPAIGGGPNVPGH